MGQGHTFCSVAVGRTAKHNVHFGFYWGSQIGDPRGVLLGEGNQYRYIQVKGGDDFPRAYIKGLLKEAHANSPAKVKDKGEITHGATITKPISPAKRSPRPTPARKG